jgi:hypothetical protein
VASARTFTERVATALLSLIAIGMATGGLALAGLGFTLRRIDSDIEGMPIITAGLMGLGGILAVSGGAGAIWTRDSGYSGGRATFGQRGVVSLVAVTIPLGLAVWLTPLISYWQDVLRLAVEYRVLETFNGPSGLVFVPIMGVLLVPGLEALAAVVVALSCLLLVLLVAARSTAAIRLSAIGTLLAGGLVAGSWVGVITTERLSPIVEAVVQGTPDAGGQEQARALALLSRHRAATAGSAITLAWAWAALVLLVLGTRGAASARSEPDAIEIEPQRPSLHDPDDAVRARALLDAADDLHRTTPPRRY